MTTNPSTAAPPAPAATCSRDVAASHLGADHQAGVVPLNSKRPQSSGVESIPVQGERAGADPGKRHILCDGGRSVSWTWHRCVCSRLTTMTSLLVR